MSKFFGRRKPAPRGIIPSPGYFLEWAAFLTILYALAHLAGLRDYTSVLNGTIGSTNLNWQTASFLGAAYVFIYLGFILGVPVLILAALILKMWQRVTATKGTADESGGQTKMD